MCKEIFLDAPNMGKPEKKFIAKAVDSGFVSTFGPYVPEFEEKFAEYIGVEKAVSTQNGTAALHVALHELGIGKDDEVIVPALTFVATVNPVLYVGARPVFVDIDKKTWNISPSEIEKNITKKTRAIIPVHLYGNPCKMDEITAIAKKYKLFVVEDATESLGAKYAGRHMGTFGDMGCFSFNGNKTITTGGGGMVASRDMARCGHIKFLVNQARDEKKGYYHPEVGFNYRMTNIEAAFGLAQFGRLGSFIKKKKLFHSIYREELSGMEDISFQEEYAKGMSSWWLNCLYFKNISDIGEVQSKLKKAGVPSRRVFMPITEFPPYKNSKKGKLANSYDIYERALCLPSSTLNSAGDVRRAARIIKSIVGVDPPVSARCRVGFPPVGGR